MRRLVAFSSLFKLQQLLIFYSWRKRQTFYIRKFVHLALVGQLAVNALASFFFLYVSMNNYPGGVAVMQLHKIKNPIDPIRVHIDVYNAQTGISRFLHMNEEWE